MASYLNARVADPADLAGCIDQSELWRGGLVVREKNVSGSSLVFVVLYVGMNVVRKGNTFQQMKLTPVRGRTPTLHPSAAASHSVHVHSYSGGFVLVSLRGTRSVPSARTHAHTG